MPPTEKRFVFKLPTQNFNCSFFEKEPTEQRERLGATHIYTYRYAFLCFAATQFFSLFFGFAVTQLARQLHQERTQVVYSNREARERPARRHSNGL